MDRTVKGLQQEAARQQEQLGLLVEQTSGLLADIRKSADKGSEQNRNAAAMHFYETQLQLRLRQYRELYERMEQTGSQLSAAAGEAREATVTATLALLRQMMAQISMEERSLRGVGEELEVWRQAVDTDAAVGSVTLLEKLRKGLRDSNT